MGAKLANKMKKPYFIVFIALILAACTQKETLSYNEQQKRFVSVITSQENNYQQLKNEIQKKEFLTSYNKKFCAYINKTKVLTNWFGFIDEIKTKESGESTAIEFSLLFPRNPAQESYSENDCVIFYCTHIVKTDSLCYDAIYNKVKNFPEGLGIYFDGVIRTKNSDEVYYHESYSSSSYFPSPKYEFWVLDVKSDTISMSANLQNAINLCYEITSPLRLNYLGKMTKEESDSTHVALLPKFNLAKKGLTNEERQYIERLGTDLVYNFLYGD